MHHQHLQLNKYLNNGLGKPTINRPNFPSVVGMTPKRNDEKFMLELFKNVATFKGGDLMLIPRVLSDVFLSAAVHFHVFISGVTAWRYGYNQDIPFMGIGEEYPYEFWVGFEYEDYPDSVTRSVEKIKIHIEQLPDHIHLLGFEIF